MDDTTFALSIAKSLREKGYTAYEHNGGVVLNAEQAILLTTPEWSLLITHPNGSRTIERHRHLNTAKFNQRNRELEGCVCTLFTPEGAEE